MYKRFSWTLPVLLVTVALAQPHAVVQQRGVRIKMRDGVMLAADVYRPGGEGRYPVLVQRTPYNRAGGGQQAAEMAARGYAVVIQDTRGRFDSGGEFYPFRYESQDGFDTVEWAAAQPWSNGKVGMYGGSYVGATQMLAAIAKPPHLEAIFPYITASEYYDGWTYQSGALMQWFASSWASGLAIDTLRRKASSNPRDWVFQLPVEHYRMLDVPRAADLAPYYDDWVKHERDDEYWKPWKISDHYAELKVKALHGGGWHDIFSKGTLKNFQGMRRESPAAADQRLLMGPWAHASTSPEGKIGGVVFGQQAVLDMTATTLKWFDYALKGARNEFATAPPVRIFVLGENVWREEREFPLARTKYTSYYLHRGVLSTQAPGQQEPQTYDYDPANPVPTLGGRLCCSPQIPPGPGDQRALEGRPDVLVFSTPPLKSDLEVTGWVTCKLWAASSAVDTDFTAMLVDVEPSGYARYLADGIVRARYRNSAARAELIQPGKVYEYNIDLWATSNLFRTGHRIRLYISSSNFPRFNRNLNTGMDTAGATAMVKASQKIYHDAAHPSALVLPVIPR